MYVVMLQPRRGGSVDVAKSHAGSTTSCAPLARTSETNPATTTQECRPAPSPRQHTVAQEREPRHAE
jgi:hypothetical protein